MQRIVSTCLLAAVAVSSAAIGPAAAEPAVRVVAGPAGGHIVFGRSGAARPLAALHDSGRSFGGLFGTAPVIASVVESVDGRAAYATFKGRYAGAPIVGVIIAASNPGGTQLVALSDRPDHIKASFAPMLAAAEGTTSSHTPAALPEPLREHVFSDNSGSISLPASWTIKGAGQGQLLAAGPNGETAVLGIGPLIVDPRAGLQAQVAQQSGGYVLPYSPDPRIVFGELQAALARRDRLTPGVSYTFAKAIPSSDSNAMMIRATQAGKDGPKTVLGVIAVSRMQMGGYTLYMQIVTAPTARVDRELPTLTAIYDSYRVNGAVRSQQVRDSERYDEAFASATIGNIHATGAAAIRAAQESDAAMDRSTSGFVHYLNGSDVVEDLTTGARGSLDSGWAQSLARDNPQDFRVVPMSQYRAGD